jgi:hypothetical protein
MAGGLVTKDDPAYVCGWVLVFDIQLGMRSSGRYYCKWLVKSSYASFSARLLDKVGALEYSIAEWNTVTTSPITRRWSRSVTNTALESLALAK